ncbi:Predicted N-formylglutamate amidohydrolase [Fibrobacter sp. UWB15]|uniref:N-formylglutamate amidohydrolase n=1 Tax=unclassified Fibrobacter TaxID=2634177 RepID=UPI00091F5325|nr:MULTISPECIES: N-formylglutamate amidohydrolase [unclassified Fibrobacter]PWJ67727.1 putative N-formylglutamate amidohydrolase [Fibrobacter sp. UWB6]SHF76311.1 Predicted N-formylglutamate amidohydrolase [Fibrobacter sp. UWB8]SMG14420.1 Predicted N-formylglutamate amidohydrolase [Fibrobacter sp. UWB15]
MKLMLTCEHASNKLPAAFKSAVPAEVLKTHRAYDIGACSVFRKLVKFAKPEFYCEGKFSRLFVDLNRTITNKSAFSDYLRNNEKAKAQATAYWTEYRAAIEKFVDSALKPKTRAARSEPEIVHLGIHSFTPVLNGKVRNADIGILYDPARPQERAYANIIKAEIKRLYPAMKVRFNYPYKGSSDGLTTTLRKKFGPRYVGIEIEINQKFFR